MIPARARRTAGHAAALLVVAAIAVVAIACGSSVPTQVVGSPSAATVSPGASPNPTPLASAPPSSTAAGSGPTVAVDEGLMDLLPVTVGGIVLTSDAATAGTIASDPVLSDKASAIAVAYAVGPGPSGADDVAVVSVVRLRPGIYDDDFFRGWRDSYDAAACEAAGGVQGNAESEIAGRQTFIGTCVAGAHTYHVYLEDHDTIVSVTSVGEQRLGEQVIAGLRE